MINNKNDDMIFSANIFKELTDFFNSKKFEKDLLDIFYLESLVVKFGDQNVPDAYKKINSEKDLIKYLYHDDADDFYFVYNILDKKLTLSLEKKQNNNTPFNIKFFSRDLGLHNNLSQIVWSYLIKQSDYNKEILLTNFRKLMLDTFKEHQKFLFDYTQKHECSIDEAPVFAKNFFGAALFDFNYFRKTALIDVSLSVDYLSKFQKSNSDLTSLRDKILEQIMLDSAHKKEWQAIFSTAFKEEIDAINAESMRPLNFTTKFISRFYMNNIENFLDVVNYLFGDEIYDRNIYTFLIFSLSFTVSFATDIRKPELNKILDILYNKKNVLFMNLYLKDIYDEEHKFLCHNEGIGYLLHYIDEKELSGIDWSMFIPEYTRDDFSKTYNTEFKNALPFIKYNNMSFDKDILSLSKEEIYVYMGKLINAHGYQDITVKWIIIRLKELLNKKH